MFTMVKCCVPTCRRTYGGFHSFPTERITFQRWIRATKAFEVDNKKNPSHSFYKVCKRHFQATDYSSEARRYLKKRTIPSVELPNTNSFVDEHNYCYDGSMALSTMSIPQKRKKIELISIETFPPGYFDLNALGLGENTNLKDTSAKMETELIPFNEDMGPECKNNCIGMENVERSETKIGHIGSTKETSETVTIRRDTYISLKRKLRYTRRQLQIVKNKMKGHLKITKSPLFNHIMKNLDSDQMSFLQLLLKNNGQKGRGRRYSFSEKSLALAWYKQSLKSYNFVSMIFPLPTYSVLCMHSAKILFEAGLNQNLLKFIKDAVADMPEKDRLCILSWDEISLKTHLEYLSTKQYIDGFLDLGSNRSEKLANHALTFMVRGVNKPYKQPICYFLTNADIGAKELSELIELVIKAILDTGLIIIASVCDQVATNAAAVNRLINRSGATVNNHKNGKGTSVSINRIKRSLKKPLPKPKPSKVELLTYKIDGHVIIHVFDPPHIIKGIRNNLLTKNLKHFVKGDRAVNCRRQRVATWDDISEFYNCNRTGSVRLVEKITDEHINPVKRKMNVKLAAQVFSNTMGQKMRSWSQSKKKEGRNKQRRAKNRDFAATADILIFFNDVFDSLNGGKLTETDVKGAIGINSNHENFWDYAVNMLKKMHFIFKEGDDVGKVSKKCKILDRLISTIRGFQEIKKTLLRYDITSFSPRRFNQDGLENFFGLIRSVCHIAVAPTTRQFKTAFATIIVTGLVKRHSLKSNCEQDFDSSLLQNVYKFFAANQDSDGLGATQNSDGLGECCKNQTVTNQNYLEEEEEEEFTENTICSLEAETLAHVAGVVYIKFMKGVKCPECKIDLQSRKFGTFHLSSTSVSRIQTIITKVEKVIPKICFELNLKSKLLDIIDLDDSLGCSTHNSQNSSRFDSIALDYIISIFAKHVNEVLTGKILVPTNEFDMIQKNALGYRQKRKGIGKYIAKTTSLIKK